MATIIHLLPSPPEIRITTGRETFVPYLLRETIEIILLDPLHALPVTQMNTGVITGVPPLMLLLAMTVVLATILMLIILPGLVMCPRPRHETSMRHVAAMIKGWDLRLRTTATRRSRPLLVVVGLELPHELAKSLIRLCHQGHHIAHVYRTND